MVLKLQEEIPLSKGVLVAQRSPARLLVHPPGEVALHLARQAGGQGDDPLVVGLQQFIVHPGFVVETVHKSLGHDLHQVLVALVVLGQQHQVVVAVLAVYILPVETGAGGHIHLAA